MQILELKVLFNPVTKDIQILPPPVDLVVTMGMLEMAKAILLDHAKKSSNGILANPKVGNGN